jgi:hypothetical protein
MKQYLYKPKHLINLNKLLIIEENITFWAKLKAKFNLL